MSRLAIGWELLLFGMGTVFLVLYLLSVILKITGKYLGPKKSPAQSINSVVDKVPNNNTTFAKNNNAKVAAIMAAIQVVMGDSDYRVISIKPTTSSNWKQALNTDGQEFKYVGRRGN